MDVNAPVFGWLKNHLIPAVKGFLIQFYRPLKTLLILDNASLRPKTDEINFIPQFHSSFLPPNYTAVPVLQPMIKI